MIFNLIFKGYGGHREENPSNQENNYDNNDNNNNNRYDNSYQNNNYRNPHQSNNYNNGGCHHQNYQDNNQHYQPNDNYHRPYNDQRPQYNDQRPQYNDQRNNNPGPQYSPNYSQSPQQPYQEGYNNQQGYREQRPQNTENMYYSNNKTPISPENPPIEQGKPINEGISQDNANIQPKQPIDPVDNLLQKNKEKTDPKGIKNEKTPTIKPENKKDIPGQNQEKKEVKKIDHYENYGVLNVILGLISLGLVILKLLSATMPNWLFLCTICAWSCYHAFFVLDMECLIFFATTLAVLTIVIGSTLISNRWKEVRDFVPKFWSSVFLSSVLSTGVIILLISPMLVNITAGSWIIFAIIKIILSGVLVLFIWRIYSLQAKHIAEQVIQDATKQIQSNI